MIDYQRMSEILPKQKAQLTRARKKGYPAVLDACRKAVEEWNRIGAWPDNWSTWQVALTDAYYEAARNGEKFAYVARLEDLQ